MDVVDLLPVKWSVEYQLKPITFAKRHRVNDSSINEKLRWFQKINLAHTSAEQKARTRRHEKNESLSVHRLVFLPRVLIIIELNGL